MHEVQKLMVSGYVCAHGGCPLSVEVRRGMPVLSQDRQEVGKVAAVVLSSEAHRATHLLLTRLPVTCGYLMIPVDRIERVENERVRLLLDSAAVDELPCWQEAEA